MEPTRFSDLDATMLANNAFDKIMELIKTSNLNFQMRLSPFSASISLKKSFIRDKFGNILVPTNVNAASQKEFNIQHENNELEHKNEQLNQKILDIENLVASKSQTVQILEAKIANAEASTVKTINEKNEEATILKKALKNANLEISKLKNEMKGTNKLLKEKDKQVYKLDQKCENLEANMKRAKEELNSIKSNFKKIQKKQKPLAESPSKNSTKIDSSNNNLVIEPSLVSPVKVVPDSRSESSSTSFSNFCEHAPQCTIRQPRPPPPPTCTTEPLLLAEGPVISSALATVHAWSSPPSSPPRHPPPQASIDSPHTPTRLPRELACSNEEQVVAEINASEEKTVKRNNILSAEVQEILKKEKLDFAKLVEAVRNDKMIYDDSEREKDDDSYSNFDYEIYPDEYWDYDIENVTEDDVEDKKPDAVY